MSDEPAVGGPAAGGGLIPRLPARAWKILAGDAVAALGTGLVLPFLVVYLRDVRDMDVAMAGLAISTLAVVSLITGPAAGMLVDRYGSRRTLLVALVFCSAGSVALAFIREPWHAFGATSLIGLGFAGLWPATHALLTSVVPVHQRSSVYAVHYATLNAGIGIGGITGGLVANVDNARSFELLYSIDALSWLVFAAVLFVMKDVGAPHESTEEEAAQDSGGYRGVIADRVFMRLLVIAVILVTVGYSQLESGFPGYATDRGGISTRILGFAFAANTFVIVGAQLFVLRWLEGKRRTRALMAICVLWAVAWAVTIASGRLDIGMVKNLGFVLAMMVFALGECMVSPSIPGMLNDLATDQVRGRYNAAYSLTFSIGHIVGPAIAGFMLSKELGEPFFAALIVICVLTLIPIRRLEGEVPERANRVTTKEPPPEALHEQIVTV